MLNRVLQAAAVAAMFTVSTVAAAQPGPPVTVHSRRSAVPPQLPVIGPENRDWMVAHFINVGQGQAILLEFSCGLALVDTGADQARTVNWLERFSGYLDEVFERRRDLNRTIDVVFLTHPHLDHTRGTSILREGSRYRFNHLVTDAETTGSGSRQQNALVAFAGRRHVAVRTSMITSTQGLRNASIDPVNCVGTDPDLRVLWGSFDQPRRWPRNGNNHSVVVRVQFGNSSFLILGDMEEDAQPELVRRYAGRPRTLNVDVYAAGHHGSKNGTTAGLVRAMQPQIAVFSAGNPAAEEPGFSAYNFGHPNIAAIDLLRDPTTGVQMARPSVTFPVGVSGRAPASRDGSRPARPPVYRSETIRHAIFSTGWDGNVVIFANRNGEKRVIVD